MSPCPEQPSLDRLLEILNRTPGTPAKDSPQARASEFIRSSAAILAPRLQLEMRVLNLVGALVEAGIPEVMVYGAAEVGRCIARTALDAGIRVPCFVESQVAEPGRRVDGIEILPFARARAEGRHIYALGTIRQAAAMNQILLDAYGEDPGPALRIFSVPGPGEPSPFISPVSSALAEKVRHHETLLHAVRHGDSELFGALLGRLQGDTGESPAPASSMPALPEPWPAGPLDPRLLEPRSPMLRATLQFTGDCNLKCTYCGHAQSGWSGQRMGEAMVEEILDFILKDGIQLVSVGMYGEATLFAGWEVICERLLDAGLTLITGSNFTRLLRTAEVDVLTRFDQVGLSIETVDLELQKRLRPPMDVRNLVYNFHRIRARALSTGRREPSFIWTGVLAPEVVPLLPEFLAFAKSCGVRHVSMNELILVVESEAKKTIFDLDDPTFLTLSEQIHQAVDLAEVLGIQFTLPMERIAGRVARIRKRMRGEPCEEVPAMRLKAFQGTAEYQTEPIPEGKVGICFLPWTDMFIMPSGELFPCCFQGQVMGKLDADHNLGEIMNNERYRALRAELLTGEGLNEVCRHCPMIQRVADPVEARAAIGALLGISARKP
jgi:MoaA/NifB/PqqE/SkfB family radical SAM enzyme